jgi:hypothetical protein
MSTHAVMRGWMITFVKRNIAANQKAFVVSAWRASVTVYQDESPRRNLDLTCDFTERVAVNIVMSRLTTTITEASPVTMNLTWPPSFYSSPPILFKNFG